MVLIRVLVCSAALAVALTPLVALADDTSPEHLQAELANGQAQFTLAQQDALNLDAQAQESAANERMIALLKSEAMRLRQLSLVANATSMEQIAAALANAARADGDLNARNELAIAQLKAANLVAIADANLANGIMLAQTKGRTDEFLNAQAQSNFLHQLASFISGRQAELNMANAKEIGQERADEIHTPKLVEEQNGMAMGANELLAADTELQAGALAATSAVISVGAKASSVLGHAASSLKNDQVRAGVVGSSAVVAEEPEAVLVADDGAVGADMVADEVTTDMVADEPAMVADEPAADAVASDDDPIE
jgi:hypothetical protein